MLVTASVVIPTFNYAKYIGRAISSVLDQTYPFSNIEIIVIDDGSTDNTEQVLAEYIYRGQIKYYYQDNKGKAKATQVGIKLSSGKYIFNLDADDYFLPDKIAEAVSVFESDQTIVHVASPAKIFFEQADEWDNETIPADLINKPLDGEWLLNWFYNRNLLFGGGSTYCARASVLRKIEIPDSVDMYIDEFLILAILTFGKSYFIEVPLSVWRVHGANYSGSSAEGDQKSAKILRLLNSSNSVLDYIKKNGFNKQLIKAYQLKDATRRIASIEAMNRKDATAIYYYVRQVFLEIKPSWHLIKNYHVINRLIPSSLFLMLKNLKNLL